MRFFLSNFDASNRYLYCNDTEIHPHCLWDTVNAANKYQLPHLLKECERQLIDSLAVRNFCDYIEFNRLFELKRLQVRCLEFWDVQARSVVHTPAFESLSCDVLIQLISRDTLDLEEIQVFNACMRWTQKQSMGHSKPIERSRNLLKTLLGEVRILDISEKEFVEGAVKSYIFNDCDFKQFFVFYALGYGYYIMSTNNRLLFIFVLMIFFFFLLLLLVSLSDCKDIIYILDVIVSFTNFPKSPNGAVQSNLCAVDSCRTKNIGTSGATTENRIQFRF